MAHDEIGRLADGMAARLVACRRDLHRYPEAGWTEFRTASLVARRLTALGWEVRLGREVVCDAERTGVPDAESLEAHYRRALQQGAAEEHVEALRGGYTGVVGRLGRAGGPVVGVRFDIDALDIPESTSPEHRPHGEAFASANPGVMHACGHDAHTAVGLALAEVLTSLGARLGGTVKLVFQPAEEGVRGARAMVAAGVVDDVDVMLGHHVVVGRQVGEVVPDMDGYTATDKFDVVFTGEAAHAGSSPHVGRNALLAACQAVMALYAIPRHGDGATRVNVGTLSAGTARNVIASRAHLAVETRGATDSLCEYMTARARRAIEGAAEAHGCEVEVRPMGAARCATSDAALVERVREVAEGALGRRLAARGASGGSEDYTYMMRRVQELGGLATNIGIGAAVPGGEGTTRAHTPTFDLDESAMQVALELLAVLVVDLLERPVAG